MKIGKLFFLVLAVCALVMAAPTNSLAREHHSDGGGGRLILKFSPILGINVGINIRIDGRLDGVITKGHVYDRHLSAGNHLVQVWSNLDGNRGRWERTLHFGSGQTRAYSIKYSTERLILEPIHLR